MHTRKALRVTSQALHCTEYSPCKSSNKYKSKQQQAAGWEQHPSLLNILSKCPAFNKNYNPCERKRQCDSYIVKKKQTLETDDKRAQKMNLTEKILPIIHFKYIQISKANHHIWRGKTK